MLIIFSGFYGLVGFNYYLTLPCFLVGCNFAYALMMWSDPANPILYRKITLVLYSIIGLVYFLFFVNMPVEQKYSSYVSTVYVTNRIKTGTDYDLHAGHRERRSEPAHLPEGHPTGLHHHLRPSHELIHPQHCPIQDHYLVTILTYPI